MSDAPTLISAIDALAERLGTFAPADNEGFPVDAAEVARVNTHALALAPEVSEAEQRALADALARLEDAIQRSLEQMADRLRQLGDARTAIGGYRTLRDPGTTAQRIRTGA